MNLTKEELAKLRELEVEDQAAVQNRSVGATGDRAVDWLIKTKVAEDNRAPPTSFGGKKVEIGDPVLGFTGGYACLANDYECIIVAGGYKFRSVQQALGYAQSIYEGDNWEVDMVQTLRSLLDQKFGAERHEWLMFHLLGTGHRHLEYVNDHGDRLLGTDSAKKNHPLVAELTGVYYDGENLLGKMLMEIRHESRLRIAGNVRTFQPEDVYR